MNSQSQQCFWRSIVRSLSTLLLASAVTANLGDARASPGDLDSTFGAGGVAQLANSPGRPSVLVLSADGGIYVVMSGASLFQVTRLTSQGNIDSAFGGTGTVNN